MNIFCDSNGVIFHVIPEKIFQGSAGVNKVYFIGQFPSSAQVLMAYTLPNGIPTTPKMLVLNKQMEEVQAPNGGKFSVWEGIIGASPKIADGQVVKDDSGNVIYDLDFTITENYGIATMQFYVYGASNRVTAEDTILNVQGGLLATASVNFTIEKGVPVVLPVSLDEEGDVSIILAQILNALANTQMLYSNTIEEIERVSTNASEESKAYYERNKADIDANKADIDANKADIEVLVAQSKVHTENIEILSGVAYGNSAAIQAASEKISGAEYNINYGLGSRLKLTVNNKTFEVEAQLIAKSGKILSTQTIDLPLESVVIGGYYDDEDKTVVLKLQHGGVVTFPIGDLVDGLLSSSEKGQPNGVASLDENGKVPAEQLPEGIGGGLPEGFNPEDYVKFTDYATGNRAGVGKVSGTYGTGCLASGYFYLVKASNAEIDGKSQMYAPIVPANLDYAVKVGLTTNTETLTDEEKTSACDWLGAVKKDTSISTTPTANKIPKYNQFGQLIVNCTEAPPGSDGSTYTQYTGEAVPRALWRAYVDNFHSKIIANKANINILDSELRKLSSKKIVFNYYDSTGKAVLKKNCLYLVIDHSGGNDAHMYITDSSGVDRVATTQGDSAVESLPSFRLALIITTEDFHHTMVIGQTGNFSFTNFSPLYTKQVIWDNSNREMFIKTNGIGMSVWEIQV